MKTTKITLSEIRQARKQSLAGGMPGWVNFKQIVNSVENDILIEKGHFPENLEKEIRDRINSDNYSGKVLNIDWK